MCSGKNTKKPAKTQGENKKVVKLLNSGVPEKRPKKSCVTYIKEINLKSGTPHKKQ